MLSSAFQFGLHQARKLLLILKSCLAHFLWVVVGLPDVKYPNVQYCCAETFKPNFSKPPHAFVRENSMLSFDARGQFLVSLGCNPLPLQANSLRLFFFLIVPHHSHGELTLCNHPFCLCIWELEYHHHVMQFLFPTIWPSRLGSIRLTISIAHGSC